MWPDRRLIDMLGIGHPILLAPMAGPGTPQLAIAVTEAGGLGVRDVEPGSSPHGPRPHPRGGPAAHTAPSAGVLADARWHRALAPYHEELGRPGKVCAGCRARPLRRGRVRDRRGDLTAPPWWPKRGGSRTGLRRHHSAGSRGWRPPRACSSRTMWHRRSRRCPRPAGRRRGRRSHHCRGRQPQTMRTRGRQTASALEVARERGDGHRQRRRAAASTLPRHAHREGPRDRAQPACPA